MHAFSSSMISTLLGHTYLHTIVFCVGIEWPIMVMMFLHKLDSSTTIPWIVVMLNLYEILQVECQS